jgi:mannosyltransferase
MGNDEVATRWAALLPLRALVHLLSNVDAVHGLYYLLMHGWVALGSSPVALRIPSVIAMAAAAVLITIIGRRLTGSGWAGLFAGLIMALTPSISFYAQTARSYAWCPRASSARRWPAVRHGGRAAAAGGRAVGVYGGW